MTRKHTLRRVAATALPGRRPKPLPFPTGCWDAPSDEGMVAGNELELTGWAVSGRRRTVPAVVVLRDGMPIARTTPQHAREDVAANLGGDLGAGPVGWTVPVVTSRSDVGVAIEVVVDDGQQRTSLGVRQLHRPAKRANDGRLDYPLHGDRIRVGSAMRVCGWALFDGEPADSVDIYLGDDPAVTVRAALPRTDVSESIFGPDEEPQAVAAGFSDLIPVPERWCGRDLEIVVRARSLDGEVWVSEPISVTVEPRGDDPREFDQGSPLIAAPLRSRHGGPVGARLRVCAFTHSLNLGGGELYMQELVLRLARDHGFEVLVVTPLDGPLKDELRAAGVAVHVTRNYAFDPARYLAGVAELAGLVSVWGADAVMANTLGVFPGVDAALALQLPVFWAIHESFSLDTFAHLNWGGHGLHSAVNERWLHCLSAASTVFESQATLEMFQAQVPELRGAVVRYGIELAEVDDYRAGHDRTAERHRLGFAADELVLLCMGVFQERKAQLALVLAFAQVAVAHPTARLVLVGDHPSEYAAAVGALIEALDLKDRILVEPIQPDTYLWYLVSDVLVSASDTESLPRSVLEAMSFGRPTLAADVFGLSEVIRDGENGWLCRAHSNASLIAGLKRVLACSREELAELSRRCEAHSRTFDGANYAADYAAMIRAAVGAAQPGEA